MYTVCLPRMMSSELRATVSSGLMRPPTSTGMRLNAPRSNSPCLGEWGIQDKPSHNVVANRKI